MDNELAQALRRELLEKGAAVVHGADDKRLFLVHSTAMQMTGQGILMAYEGGGTFFWAYASDQRPLNRFRLTAAGFRIDLAEAILQIVGDLELTEPELIHQRVPGSGGRR
ncbi:hypothetical protein JYK14_24495 [Siccirubricoccus sp. KC 17139]|uniref:Integron cassette protein VCH-CASS1 chain domain-containing protein n=1 Tax=Siccirubricoccus soli TaxID=2899147 RepID=A0ABT1DE91_9PROT|nr:hypothetical protein [Siccirubricoccus soli]MCO6419295.1 hypothetical protein [Siccirubricoccus soli]MCP2685430.1 hypothetical protein [Siccirubricoccus soli]